MSELLDHAPELRRRLIAAAVPADAEPMAAYMRGHFSFLGVKTPARRAAQKPTIDIVRHSDAREVVEFVHWCWQQPEREFQSTGADALRVIGRRLPIDLFDDVHQFLTTKSWWDTVDAIAVHTVGTMVRTFPELIDVMDDWIDDEDFWLARVAIIHQLMSKDKTDAERLFAYCEARKHDEEFFIRKAIGWALRQYARTNPAAVIAFVTANDDLSGLSKREALNTSSCAI
ncbi:MAG: DNA alkylation repair protein [Acidimicrobiales bacterium]